MHITPLRSRRGGFKNRFFEDGGGQKPADKAEKTMPRQNEMTRHRFYQELLEFTSSVSVRKLYSERELLQLVRGRFYKLVIKYS